MGRMTMKDAVSHLVECHTTYKEDGEDWSVPKPLELSPLALPKYIDAWDTLIDFLKRNGREALVNPSPNPRYDDVYEEGVKWLEEQ